MSTDSFLPEAGRAGAEAGQPPLPHLAAMISAVGAKTLQSDRKLEVRHGENECRHLSRDAWLKKRALDMSGG